MFKQAAKTTDFFLSQQKLPRICHYTTIATKRGDQTDMNKPFYHNFGDQCV